MQHFYATPLIGNRSECSALKLPFQQLFMQLCDFCSGFVKSVVAEDSNMDPAHQRLEAAWICSWSYSFSAPPPPIPRLPLETPRTIFESAEWDDWAQLTLDVPGSDSWSYRTFINSGAITEICERESIQDYQVPYRGIPDSDLVAVAPL